MGKDPVCLCSLRESCDVCTTLAVAPPALDRALGLLSDFVRSADDAKHLVAEDVVALEWLEDSIERSRDFLQEQGWLRPDLGGD